MENEIKKQLEEKYLIKVEDIEKNSESTNGNVYIVYSNDKKYVIKLYTKINHTKAMINLHSLLTLSGMNIPNIIPSRANKSYEMLSNGNYFVMYSFMEGEQIAWNPQSQKLDNNTITLIARILRTLHTVTQDRDDLGLPNIPFENKDNIKRYSILHFDITKNNIFSNKIAKNQIGLIDFDDAKYGPSVCDIAITIANLFFSKTRGVDIDGMYQFINEYYYDNPTFKGEELVVIKKYALQWIDYILDGNEFDTSTTESFTVRRMLLEQYLLF